MRRSAVEGAALLLALVLVVSACTGGGDGGDGAAATTSTVPPPAALPGGQDLYAPPDELLAGPPGSLVWFEELPPIGAARAWRVLQRSTDAAGRPTWGTGLVFRPAADPPADGFPVAVWAHGTAGLADRCAPSHAGAQVPALGDLLQAGFVVVAPDGAGLGPPGPAQYLVGGAEGRALLDAARAAAAIPGSDASSEVALWGYSSGGQAALFAAQQAQDYAPDLDVLGTVAVAPVSDLARFAGRASTLPLTFGYSFLTFGAWAEVYDDADLGTIFTPAVIGELPLLDQECAPAVAPHFALTSLDELRVADPQVTPPWPELMATNSVAAVATEGPVLLVQGTEDPIIAPESTDSLAARLCDAGATVELRRIPGRHDVVLRQAASIAEWLTERSAGVPAGTTCPS